MARINAETDPTRQHYDPDTKLYITSAEGPLPGGAHEEGAGPDLPQCKVSGIASDFWGPRWASQSQIPKIAAISMR